MRRFATDAFRFDLPGDSWREETLQHFSPDGDEQSAFMIGRRERATDAADVIARTLGTFPNTQGLEVEMVRAEQVEVGPLPATDLGIITRTTKGADYLRVVIIPYYDQDIYLNWGGPAVERDAIDVRAARTLETMRFRQR